jgi:enoyl-CoA hydratase/carnithine racemase
MTDTPDPVVAYACRDRVATITLDRPAYGNAMTLQLCAELVDALDRADADDEVAAALLTGRGRNFCVGADLHEGFNHPGREQTPQQTAFAARFGEIGGAPRDAGGVVTLRLAAMLKPVIAAVNGAAVGGGASMLLPADIRVVSASTRIGFVFARRGMPAESASSWFLPRIVGVGRALEWVLTGRILNADEVVRAGLANAVVADDELLPTAYAIADEIVANTSTVAVAVSRQLLWSMLGQSSPWDAHLAESRAVSDLAGRADVAEGVLAFLEKRPPRFPLRVPADYPPYAPHWPTP